MNPANFLTIADIEVAARRRLPPIVWDRIAGGGGDEVSLRRNRTAFANLLLRPHALRDVAERDLSTTVLGERVSLPVILGPTGFGRVAHRDGELATARAAGRIGTVFVQSSVGSYSLEETARVATGPRWFQMYVPPSRDQTATLLGRVEAAGYTALVVTIDNAVQGLRERDARNRFAVPLRITPQLVAQAAIRPAWAYDFIRGGAGRSGGLGAVRRELSTIDRAVRSTARAVTIDDIRWIRERWKGRLAVKGILRGEDCLPLVDAGVDGIMVSNHGGRQLDTVPAPIEVLPEVAAAVAGRAEVFVDGGFRRGVDVAKGLALGARAVLIGRPYVYGLAVGGEAGVQRVLEIYRNEISHTMALLGCRAVADLDPSYVAAEREVVPFTAARAGD